MQRSPKRSARRHSLTLQISRRSLHRILKAGLKFHPYKFQVVHELRPIARQMRIAFCAQLQEMIADNNNILPNLLMSDEAHFHLTGLSRSKTSGIGQKPTLTRSHCQTMSQIEQGIFEKDTRIRLYNTLARPMLSYGSEAWILRKADKSRITACEMRFMRRTAGYAKWDLKRNCEILKELNTQPVLDYIIQYQLENKTDNCRGSSTGRGKIDVSIEPHIVPCGTIGFSQTSQRQDAEVRRYDVLGDIPSPVRGHRKFMGGRRQRKLLSCWPRFITGVGDSSQRSRRWDSR
ncbi:hypothetical protein ANN_10795 [Periplaneta americana]|uniref:Uncharacterized protein n=1 Tax=Periplaneta americana TaxID=6978 RepID=A0ABQ8T4F4_PERAM|nr:hypothetical protein ANN_10795 [Periplaneta americana]